MDARVVGGRTVNQAMGNRGSRSDNASDSIPGKHGNRKTGRSAGDAVLFLDTDGRVTVWTVSASAATGIPASEALGRPITDFCPGIDADRAIRTASESGFAEFFGHCARKAGKSVPVRIAITPSHDPSGGLIGFAAVLSGDQAPPVTGFTFNNNGSESASGVTDGAETSALLVSAADRRIVRASAAAFAALGLGESDLIGRRVDEIMAFPEPGTDDPDSAGAGSGFPTIVQYSVPGGGERSFEYSMLEVWSDGGDCLLYVLNDVTHWVDARQDITRINLELSHLARHDHLTGLFNKPMFLDTLELANSRLGRSGDRLGVLYIDLDGFKPVNDQFGHDTGDQVLIEIGRRLRGAVRNSDVIARLGGDEFGAILENLKSPEDATMVAEHLIESLVEPIAVDRQHITISASIGAVVTDRKVDDSGHLLTQADRMMYQAKKQGAGGVALENFIESSRQSDAVP